MSSPAQSLQNMARGGKVIRPGASLSRAAQPLADPRRAEGKYPYQWDYPGPHSRWQMPNGSIAIPALGTEASVSQAIFSYQVPEGFRFRPKNLVLNGTGADWQPGAGVITWTLQVVSATGTRVVEFLNQVAIPIGSNTFFPKIFFGRLEFDPLDVIEAIVTNNGLVTPSPTSFAYAFLVGEIYPSAESGA